MAMPPVLLRKRKRSASVDAAADSEDPATRELRALLLSAAASLSFLPSRDAVDALLVLKREPKVAPGAFSCDVALKLFFQFVRRQQKTSDSDALPSSAAALAAALVAAMQQLLESDNHRFRRVLRVLLPQADVPEHRSLRGDRVLLFTREFAQLRSAGDARSLSEQLGLTLLYEDDAVAVVDKPADVLSVDGLDEAEVSIQRRVQQLCAEARMVHRLDFATSGILLVALTRTAAQSLSAQFRARTVQKTYLAKVLGHVQGDAGTIELAMGPHPTQKLVQIVHGAAEQDQASGARWSTTHWRVLRRSVDVGSKSEAAAYDGEKDGRDRDGDDEKAASFEWTLIELKPVTGKTHQLRVHMQHVGHPILGDTLYSPELVADKSPRLCLHAAKLEVLHPVTDAPLTIQSPCPFDE